MLVTMHTRSISHVTKVPNVRLENCSVIYVLILLSELWGLMSSRTLSVHPWWLRMNNERIMPRRTKVGTSCAWRRFCAQCYRVSNAVRKWRIAPSFLPSWASIRRQTLALHNTGYHLRPLHVIDTRLDYIDERTCCCASSRIESTINLATSTPKWARSTSKSVIVGRHQSNKFLLQLFWDWYISSSDDMTTCFYSCSSCSSRLEEPLGKAKRSWLYRIFWQTDAALCWLVASMMCCLALARAMMEELQCRRHQ